MKDIIQIGRLIEGPADRDAIHIAVAPVTAGPEALRPGMHVGLSKEGCAIFSTHPIGVVDPYLQRFVSPGEQFWLFLYPSTITGMRHSWRHPSFESEESPTIREELIESLVFISETASRCGKTYGELMNDVENFLADRQEIDNDNFREDPMFEDDWQMFWRHYGKVTGKAVHGPSDGPYTYECPC